MLFSLVEKLGPAISIFALASVLFAAVAMGILLSRFSLRKVWVSSLIVGAISLAAHLFDYYVTLKLSPNLAQEANPIWRIVVDNFGIDIAKAYGLSGKILLAVLSFEFFSYYLIQRTSLFPQQKGSFLSFWREFGVSHKERSPVRWVNLVNFFSFNFALIGPFMFYIVLLNIASPYPWYYRLPSMPVMLFLYLIILVIAYLVTTHRAFCHLPKDKNRP